MRTQRVLHGVADDRELRLRGFSPVKDAQSGSSCRKAQNFWPEKFQKATTAVATNVATAQLLFGCPAMTLLRRVEMSKLRPIPDTVTQMKR